MKLQNTGVIYHSIASNLLQYLHTCEAQNKIPSCTRLEREVFGDVQSLPSLRFWEDMIDNDPAIDFDNTKIANYRILLFCFFIAMTDEEIAEIRDSYFANPEARRNVNRSAV